MSSPVKERRLRRRPSRGEGIAGAGTDALVGEEDRDAACEVGSEQAVAIRHALHASVRLVAPCLRELEVQEQVNAGEGSTLAKAKEAHVATDQ